MFDIIHPTRQETQYHKGVIFGAHNTSVTVYTSNTRYLQCIVSVLCHHQCHPTLPLAHHLAASVARRRRPVIRQFITDVDKKRRLRDVRFCLFSLSLHNAAVETKCTDTCKQSKTKLLGLPSVPRKKPASLQFLLDLQKYQRSFRYVFKILLKNTVCI